MVNVFPGAKAQEVKDYARQLLYVTQRHVENEFRHERINPNCLSDYKCNHNFMGLFWIVDL